MDLRTRYLGMNLRTPLVPSASPLSDTLDNLRRMEDAGASAVVLYSLFEEQLTREREALDYHLTHGTESFAESLTYFPAPEAYRAGPEGYLEKIRKAKKAVGIPIIASLNGSSIGGWVDYAKKIEEAGADALELNVYFIPTDPAQSSAVIEQTYVDILKAVKFVVSIPVALKLSPFFSSMAHMARRFDDAGADALVLFNRFYQPDMDLDNLEIRPNVLLSTPQALRLPLRWVAILYGRIKADLAATSGIHSSDDVLKVLLAGANVAQLCSVLLRHGIEHIREIEKGMIEWMKNHEYESVSQLQGSMSQKNCADPSSFERAQYMQAVIAYKA
ncbi:MAG: dihydroorotate dehydrogenase-like protein [Acidobacteriia bacterium]|nr:dihydroorotate dehydrogenase-like protein [Terriglobia bacterium]